MDITNSPLESEAQEIFNLFTKLTNCLKDYFSSDQFNRNKFRSILSSNVLSKCLSFKTWIDREKHDSKYSLSVNVRANNEFYILVENLEQKFVSEENSVLVLIAGDSQNNLLYFSEDM